MRTKSRELMNAIKKFIEDFYDAKGYSPTVREIAEGVGSSKTNVARYLSEMAENGMLIREDDEYVTPQTKLMDASVRTVPIVGYVPCGPLTEEVECIDGYVKLPTAFLRGATNVFLLTASGTSMIGVGIDDGDLILVKQQQTAEDGEIVVALVDNEVTLKRYYNEPWNNRVRLHPENPTMKDIYVTDCQIQGVAIKVIKDL